MKQYTNEIKRMQQLAGIINEGKDTDNPDIIVPMGPAFDIDEDSLDVQQLLKKNGIESRTQSKSEGGLDPNQAVKVYLTNKDDREKAISLINAEYNLKLK
jgi:hypothetical protein